jgi:hypothetical protein
MLPWAARAWDNHHTSSSHAQSHRALSPRENRAWATPPARIISVPSEAFVVNRVDSRQLTEWRPLRRPVRSVTDETYFLLPYVSSSDVATLLVVIWMGMAIIPVIRLLLLVRL